MTIKKGTEKGDERLEVVEEALSRSEQFIQKYQKHISIVVLALVAIVLAYFGINRYYLEPREKEAQVQMFMAEKYFESDSLNKALNGDSNNLGFIAIIDEFGGTKSGNLAKYYAGISHLRLGEYTEAIRYLKKFKSKDQIIGSLAIGATADAYLELNETSKAADLYLQAAKKSNNELTTPMMLFKAGRTFEILGKTSKSLELYEQIQKEYPNSIEGRSVDKYIAAAQAKLAK